MLWIGEAPQFRHAEPLGLRVSRILELGLKEHHYWVPCLGKADTVAHGGGSAGSSGAYTYENIVSLSH